MVLAADGGHVAVARYRMIICQIAKRCGQPDSLGDAGELAVLDDVCSEYHTSSALPKSAARKRGTLHNLRKVGPGHRLRSKSELLRLDTKSTPKAAPIPWKSPEIFAETGPKTTRHHMVAIQPKSK